MSDNQKTAGDGNRKPVFVRLKPGMTREQMKRNLIAALEKSDITVRPVEAPKDKGDLV